MRSSNTLHGDESNSITVNKVKTGINPRLSVVTAETQERDFTTVDQFKTWVISIQSHVCDSELVNVSFAIDSSL